MWRTVRRIWISLGLGVTAVFSLWSLVAYRASDRARFAMNSNATVEVLRNGALIEFRPVEPMYPLGILFFPGALVDPIAYAPLARGAAEAGFVAYIIPLPRRGAFGGADDPSLFARADSLLDSQVVSRGWVVAGHSRGGVVASTIAHGQPERLHGLLLLGTSHPRDVDLSGLSIPVAKIAGTRDGLASRAKVEANAHLLPGTTEWTWIEGGNHSQFGWYGFQPGDRRATVSRQEQQAEVIRTTVRFLKRVASGT